MTQQHGDKQRSAMTHKVTIMVVYYTHGQHIYFRITLLMVVGSPLWRNHNGPTEPCPSTNDAQSPEFLTSVSAPLRYSTLPYTHLAWLDEACFHTVRLLMHAYTTRRSGCLPRRPQISTTLHNRQNP